MIGDELFWKKSYFFESENLEILQQSSRVHCSSFSTVEGDSPCATLVESPHSRRSSNVEVTDDSFFTGLQYSVQESMTHITSEPRASDPCSETTRLPSGASALVGGNECAGSEQEDQTDMAKLKQLQDHRRYQRFDRGSSLESIPETQEWVCSCVETSGIVRSLIESAVMRRKLSHVEARFSFTVRKADGVHLGLMFLIDWENNVLCVEDVQPDSTIASWNAFCTDDNKKVLVGDRVVSVNGIRYEPELMSQECERKTLVTLEIVREGFPPLSSETVSQLTRSKEAGFESVAHGGRIYTNI
eukprot:TRINITY_DN24410_c0_g1_i1.p1 TRINITY_DN24410_c0_g1~~TRINITY_DN24410_c0_g1_i1.p1  ORF type:complete len:318 (-),score=22.04 TRINITY_DN24410_c0_g1_i1:458-1360(-)